MTIDQQDFEQIACYVREHLHEWLAEDSLGKPPRVYEIELRERMVRIEEELKNQRDLMQQGFSLMDKRFEESQANSKQLIELIEKRFDAVDKRFEDSNLRFEAIDKRFDAIDKRFEDINQRFEAVNKRFEDINQRFEAVDRRFEAVDRHFEEMRTDMNDGFKEINRRLDRFMLWSLGLTITAAVFVVNFLK